MSTNELTDSVEPIKIPIQDLIVGRFMIPHHMGYGYPNPQREQVSEVKLIDVPVVVHIREGIEILFEPGSENANIECITYSCVLLNDLLDVDDVKDFLPDHPKEEQIHINEFMNLINEDNLPTKWFVYHREVAILCVHLKIDLREDLDPIIIESGTDWATMWQTVRARFKLLELKEDRPPIRSDKDYTPLKSKPAKHRKVKQQDPISESRLDHSFLQEMQNLLGK